MNYLRRIIPSLILTFGIALPGYATVLVSNVWNTGVRSYPAYNDTNSPYSEMGVDYNGSGDFESAWFSAGSGSAVTTVHHLSLQNGSSSTSWTTYFTPESSPVTLAGVGDQLKVTWVFTPSNVNTNNTSQQFVLCVVDSPSSARLTADGAPGSAAYTGYAMYMNMGQTLGNNNPFQLRERSVASGDLMTSSGNWAALANGAASGNHGYDSGTPYTFVMTFAHNASDGLDITATMSGGSLNNSGSATVSFTDSTPNSFTFDMFALRPQSAAKTADAFDTTLFQVEVIPGASPPSISIDPQDQTALVGQDATFSVLADGTLPLGYQWYYNTNTVLTNATGSTLTLTNAQLPDSGSYSVVVTNAYGSATSAVAQLTVKLAVAPSITTQPLDQTNILPGAAATFSVVAGGSEPLSYQWYYNTTTLLTNATDSILTITDVQPANAGIYSVVVNNLAGSVTSSNAILTVNTNPVAPVFALQPASQIVLIGSTASFAAVAAGTAPISYQWNKNGTPISGATAPTLILTNVQTSDDGNYTVAASNLVGTATSDTAVLTVTAAAPVVNTEYNLTGFGRNATGGGVLPDTDPNYAKVYTATDLANAINSKTVKIIEIMNDLNLGYNEIEASAKASSEPFRAHNPAQLHPVLLRTGVSLIDIQKKNGLTIFSANGATIRHATFNVKSSGNVIIRNLKFDEMWEWDEASKGNYDKNDWDFIDLGNSGTVSNIWVDHCTFTKAYDGIIDMKGGSPAITISWCKYTGDDGATNANSWVWQQINSLESNRTSYAMYNFLRTRGFSTTNIVTIIQGHDKTHLIGATTANENTNFTVTLHHEWFMNPWDRLPRLRGGNVHDYNIYVDDTAGLAARRLRDAVAATMSTADQNTLNNTYSFKPFLNGSISTEGGAVLVEKSAYMDCLTPLRNNQTDPSNPFYTGKILALDTIYQMDSVFFRGNSTDPGGTNTLGPLQAPIIPFSWNLPGNQLPYAYNVDDPSQLQAILAAGCGAGVLTWNKTNWLITSYAPTAPFIVAHPQSQTIAPSNSVTFTVVAAGSAPLAYQWYFNTNTAITGATNTTLVFNNIQTTNAGVYSVVVTNTAGSVVSSNALLIVSSGTLAPPQLSGVGFSNGLFNLTINGDSGPDYIVQASTNLVDWTSIFTNHSPTPPFVWSDTSASNFSLRFYRIQLGP